MAEVGQRLGSGVYRLSALRNRQSRPMSTGESPGSLLATCAVGDSRVKEGPTRDQREVRSGSESRATRRKPEKFSRARKSKRQQENVSLLCAASLQLDSSPFVVFAQTRESAQAYKTTLRLAARLQPLLQEKLLPCRMTPWTRGAVSVHPDSFRSPQQQQLRALCTVIFMLVEQGEGRPGCGQRLRGLKLHPDPSAATTRNYSWRGAGSASDAPLLYRSRTAYYDILKVSPTATQSQIKTAYYKQSFIYHPDKNPGSKEATQRFSEVSEAYTVLGNTSLRRKYDRGILSHSDVQGAGRPTSKEAAGRSMGSPQQQQQQRQQRARQFSQTGGRPMYDFDAFYRAHYGEQLQRERDMRARMEHAKEKQRKNLQKWRQARMVEGMVLVMMTVGGVILMSLVRP